MFRTIRTIVILVALAALAVTGAPADAEDKTPARTTAPVCHEDQPCWDCETMGNRVCGTVPPTEPEVRPVTGRPNFTG